MPPRMEPRGDDRRGPPAPAAGRGTPGPVSGLARDRHVSVPPRTFPRQRLSGPGWVSRPKPGCLPLRGSAGISPASRTSRIQLSGGQGFTGREVGASGGTADRIPVTGHGRMRGPSRLPIPGRRKPGAGDRESCTEDHVLPVTDPTFGRGPALRTCSAPRRWSSGSARGSRRRGRRRSWRRGSGPASRPLRRWAGGGARCAR